jgi:hypothetical protein
MGDLGKVLVGFGVLLVMVGAVLMLVGTLSGRGGWIGHLPGDIHVQRGNWTFYFPLTTSLLLSLFLTIVFSFFSFFDRR